MLQLERINDEQETLLFLFDNLQSKIFTQMPGFALSWDDKNDTVVVRPAIKFMRQDRLGNRSWVQLPDLKDVPVIRQRSGDCALTFPIKTGDECLISWGNRCIDAWWQSGGVQQQASFRMHDLSDGFATFGPASLPKVIKNISKTTTQLRSLDGETYVELDPAGQVVSIVANKGINLTAAQGKITMTAQQEIDLVTPITNISGAIASGTDGEGDHTATFNADVQVNGTTTGTGPARFASVGVNTHTHSDPQGGDVGLPTG